MVSDAVMMLDVSVVAPFDIPCDHSSVEFLVSCPSDLPSNLFFIVCNLVLLITSFLLANASAILFVDEFWNAYSMYLNGCIEKFCSYIRIVSTKPPCLKRICKLLLQKKQ